MSAVRNMTTARHPHPFVTLIAAALMLSAPGDHAAGEDALRHGSAAVSGSFAVSAAARAGHTSGAGRIRGLIVPRRQATISAAIAATIEKIGPDNGDRFAKGDQLVVFDCGIYNAELKRAEAVAEAADDTLRVKRALAASGSVSRLQATLAEAEIKKAAADVLVAKARVADCTVPAPFSGRVVRRVANAFETVAPRDPLIEIVDDSEIEVHVFVPSLWLPRLAPGVGFSFAVDETGDVAKAEIISLGATIDNVSQLIELRARIVSPGAFLLAGMSGNAFFTLRAPHHGRQ